MSALTRLQNKLGALGSAGLVGIIVLVTNMLGFVREVVAAKYFGASALMDAFVSANATVASIYLTFAAGTIAAAFMPRYQLLREQDNPAAAYALFKRCAWLLCLVLGLVSIIFMAIPDTIVSFLYPGFSDLTHATTVRLLPVLAPMIVIVALGALLQSVLNVHRHFALPAVVPLLNNITIIAILTLGAASYGILGLAGAYSVSSLLWIIALLPPVLMLGRNNVGAIPAGELRHVLISLIPLAGVIAVDQVSGVIQKSIISGVDTGAIAALNYGGKIAGLPIGIFAGALSMVLFPNLISAVNSKDRARLSRLFTHGILALIALLLPCMIVTLLKSHVLITLILQRGAFDAAATERTAIATFWYGTGVLGQALIVYFQRVMYAGERYGQVFKVTFFSSILQVLVCYGLVRLCGWPGIAMGTSIYGCVFAGWLYLSLRERAPLDKAMMRASLRRVGIANGLLAAVLLLPLPTSTLMELAKIMLGSTVYLGLLWWWKEESIAGLLKEK